MAVVARSGEWADLTVICGVRRWDGAPGSGLTLATGLAAHTPVLYVDPPAAMSTDGDATPELRVVGPGLARLTPRGLPGRPRIATGPIASAFARRSLRRAIGDLGSPTVRAVIVSSLDPWFGVCDEDLRVFYGADDFLAAAVVARLSDERLARELRRFLAAVDIVVAASPALAEVFRAEGIDPVVLPSGFDDPALTSTAGPAPTGAGWLDGPLAGFVGDLSSQVDLEVLDAVAARGHSVLLVGRGPLGPVTSGLRALAGRPNVAWVGPRAQAEIPSLLAGIDVGLAPYVDSPFGRASLRLDLLGHLAAGRPVVGTDCEAVRWLRAGGGEAPVLTDDDLAIAESPSAFADLVGARLGATPDPEAVARREHFADRHRWSQRCAQLADVLEVGDRARGGGRILEVAP